jgi:hypothetical protein
LETRGHGRSKSKLLGGWNLGGYVKWGRGGGIDKSEEEVQAHFLPTLPANISQISMRESSQRSLNAPNENSSNRCIN